MAVASTAKRYSQDLGIPIPMVRFGPSEFPRLNAGPAPYLPLQLENDRHNEFYVVLTGKVIALDSRGFVVPAGLGLQLEGAFGIRAAGPAAGNWNDVAVSGIERYDATDVAQAVLNARGVQCVLNEPVVRALLTDAPAAAAENLLSGLVPAANLSFGIGNHIGVAPYSFLRAGSDVMERAALENEFHPAEASGPDATVPYDPTQLRHLAWELQNRVTALVAAECLVFPVVESRADSAVLIEGQALAISGATSIDPFVLGSYVTYNMTSDIVPHVAALVGAAPDAATDAEISLEITRYHSRAVGQIVRKNVRFPSSLLDSVKTRWESSVPGFQELDRMPGSATGGNPWRIHTAGTTYGEIQVSLLMR